MAWMKRLDVGSAAKRYGVRAATVRRWIREGDLPATKDKGRYLLTDRDMRRALQMPRRRGRPPAIQRTRRFRWAQRISFPGDSLMGLGDAGETWRKDLEADWESYRFLLPDVAEAAAAIEYTAEKTQSAIAIAEAYYVPYMPALIDGPEPELGRGASHPSIADAYCEYANLLFWIRALDDRLDHTYKGRRLGMLPALAPGPLRDQATVLAIDFRSRLADEAGFLANYPLHHSTIPYPFNSSAKILDGRLELIIPNRVRGPVTRWEDLRYSDRRTLSAYAAEASGIVVTFMDALLDAFVANLPKRVRRDPAESA